MSLRTRFLCRESLVFNGKMIKEIKGYKQFLKHACRMVNILITDLSQSPPFDFLDWTFHPELKMAYFYYLCTVWEREGERLNWQFLYLISSWFDGLKDTKEKAAVYLQLIRQNVKPSHYNTITNIALYTTSDIVSAGLFLL